MNVPLLLAGIMSFVGAAIHAVVGDLLLVRRLDVGSLLSTATSVAVDSSGRAED